MLSGKCELVSVRTAGLTLFGAEATPFGECGGQVQLEVLTGEEAALLIEVVVDQGGLLTVSAFAGFDAWPVFVLGTAGASSPPVC